MKRELAENLLARITGWDDESKARECACLEILSKYKYDQYQQFAPGRRFLESLALWLSQFKPGAERRIAYDFVRRRLVFISDEEISYLVDLAFPTIIRPILLLAAAGDGEVLSRYRVKALAASRSYRQRLRKTLILGLSDGARTDRFRRMNPHSISHEQVVHAYDISDDKIDDLREKLKKDLTNILGRVPSDDDAIFQYVVLLDDFTASGTSYIRSSDNPAGWEGKIAKIVAKLEEPNGLGGCIAKSDVRVLVVIYIASTQAQNHIQKALERLKFAKGSIELYVVFQLSEATQLKEDEDSELFDLLGQSKYFDPIADDENAAVGGTSMQFGYNDGRLPIVLSHNTPNNSVYLLWAEDVHKVLGLFPRVSRHRRFR